MRTLEVALLTEGDPGRLTGGFLFHRRLAGLAPESDARLRFISLPARRWPLALVDAPAALRRARRLRPDVLVLDSIATALVGPWLAIRPLDLPVAGMLHQPPGGIDGGRARRLAQAPLDRLAYRACRRLLVASESLQLDLLRDGQSAERLRVVPPGRDVAPTPPAGLTPELRSGRKAAFLCVGNWMRRKGIHDLLEAFARLPRDAATLHLAGATDVEPAYAARLRRRLSRPDLTSRVVVHGALPLAEVAALYAAADAFVLPSYREPFGTVYGEAMAAGLPVAGWRAGNLPFLADDGCEALLLRPGDVPGLSRALQTLAEDEALRRRLGQAALQRAASRPTWRQTADLFFSTLRQLVHE